VENAEGATVAAAIVVDRFALQHVLGLTAGYARLNRGYAGRNTINVDIVYCGVGNL
jgi:hypothetical protein